MEWWNDLWLNEGFASFMENVGVNHIYPEWKMMDQSLLDANQNAMTMDQLTNSHPIMADVKDPAQINSLFDSISYSKVSDEGLVVLLHFVIRDIHFFHFIITFYFSIFFYTTISMRNELEFRPVLIQF